MNYQIRAAPGDESEYLLFSFMLAVKDVGYKGAVAESLNDEISDEGEFDVLLLTATGNHFFSVGLNEDAVRKASNKDVEQEIIDKIGETIKVITG